MHIRTIIRPSGVFPGDAHCALLGMQARVAGVVSGLFLRIGLFTCCCLRPESNAFKFVMWFMDAQAWCIQCVSQKGHKLFGETFDQSQWPIWTSFSVNKQTCKNKKKKERKKKPWRKKLNGLRFQGWSKVAHDKERNCITWILFQQMLSLFSGIKIFLCPVEPQTARKHSICLFRLLGNLE